MAIGQASSLIQHSSSSEQRRTDSSMWKYIKYLNVFVFCKFLKLLGNIMVLLVLGIVGFTWYAVVPGYYGPLMLVGPAGRAFGSTLLVLVFSILVSLLFNRAKVQQSLCAAAVLLSLFVFPMWPHATVHSHAAAPAASSGTAAADGGRKKEQHATNYETTYAHD